MATYKQIQEWVRKEYGFLPKKSWIAEVKRMSGLPTRKIYNRIGDTPVSPCPPDKVEPIKAALAFYRMI